MALAGLLAQEEWISAAEVTGPGYLTVTVTPGALAAVADDVTKEGPACVTSDALAGVTVPAAPVGDPLAAPTWEEARAALAARLTARLAAAAGATVASPSAAERERLTHPPHAPASDSRTPPVGAERGDLASDRSESGASPVRSEDSGTEPGAEPRSTGPATAPSGGYGGASPRKAPSGGYGGPSPREAPSGGYGGPSPREATAFAGRDAVTVTLARAIPGRPLRVDPRIIARHVPGNPAYAVRYAHARAASGLRWAAASWAADTISSEEAPQPSLADSRSELAVPVFRRDTGGYGGSPPKGVTALLDALSWLPERVAAAARRGRPDEFARYLEDLASVTVDVLSSTLPPGSAAAPGSDNLPWRWRHGRASPPDSGCSKSARQKACEVVPRQGGRGASPGRRQL